MRKEYISTNTYCRRVFGSKVYKLALSAAMTCPNRDGTKGYGGCTFCSAGGSGDFAQSAALPVVHQIEKAKLLLGEKAEKSQFLAYFQSFTGTYGDLEYLEQRYQEAVNCEDIVGLSIATRPDCLSPKAMAMLARLARQKPLWVELGLQTMHEQTAQQIRRGYPLQDYESAMQKLEGLGVHRITHVIFGLPGESREDMLDTIRYVGQRTDGIKIQLLHVLRGTKLAEDYRNGRFHDLEQQTYLDLVAEALKLLPNHVVIHRMTGDGAKRDLIAPQWSADKKRVLAELNRTLRANEIFPAKE